MNSMNKDLIKNAISDSGLKLSFIAMKLGISREGFYNKVNGKTEFNVSEINKFCEILNLKDPERDAIFFNNKSE